MLWETLQSEMKADFPLFKVFEDKVKLPNGLTLDYYRVEKTPAVVILPLMKEKIVMVKQYRYPIQTESLELPAGHMKPDEPPVSCARRELKEETGFTSKKIQPVLSYYPSTEYSDQVYHIFIAEELQEGTAEREKYELMDMEILPVHSVIDKIIDGSIKDGRTITAVFLAKFMKKM
jgi:ADP-ribose pyrophosphatase